MGNEDKDDSASTGLDWCLEPVQSRQDDEEIIDSNTMDFAIEIIQSNNPNTNWWNQMRSRKLKAKNEESPFEHAVHEMQEEFEKVSLVSKEEDEK